MLRLSDGELNVMNVLWGMCLDGQSDGGSALSLGEIVDALKPVTGWSRNTVHTYLTRMENKGLVAINRTSEPHRYGAAVSRED